MLGLTESARVQEILLPGAAPGILTGLRLGFGYAWRALVGAELIAAASGLGYLIEDASSLARTDVVMVGILTIAGLGILCDQLFRRGAEAGQSRALTAGGKAAEEKLPLRQFPHHSRSRTQSLGHCVRGFGGELPGLTQPPVDHLTLSIAPGSVTAVLGRSGCGKRRSSRQLRDCSSRQAGAVRFTSPDASGGRIRKLPWCFRSRSFCPGKRFEKMRRSPFLPARGRRFPKPANLQQSRRR